MVGPSVKAIGRGIRLHITPEAREAILRELYARGTPVMAVELSGQTLSFLGEVTGNWPALLLNTVDVLEHMVNNGDLARVEKSSHGWKTAHYYLSAREFVRITDADNRAKGKQAVGAFCRRVGRFFRRLFRR